MKKLAALVLALITLFSLAAAASADGAGTYYVPVATQTGALPSTEAVIDVDITWGDDLTPYWNFRVKNWDSENHEYIVTPGYWEGQKETSITIVNHSNVGVMAKLDVSYASGFSYFSSSATNGVIRFLVGESKDNMTAMTNFGREMTMNHAVGVARENAPTKTMYIALDEANSYVGKANTEVFNPCQLKLTISAYGAVAE